MNNKVLFMSIITGEIYSVSKEENNNVDEYQLPIKDYPKSSCKKCLGRGHLGFNNSTNSYEICNCVRKQIDFSRVNPEFLKKKAK